MANQALNTAIQTAKANAQKYLAAVEKLEADQSIAAVPEMVGQPLNRLSSADLGGLRGGIAGASTAIFTFVEEVKILVRDSIPLDANIISRALVGLQAPLDAVQEERSHRAAQARARQDRVAEAARRVPALLKKQEAELRRELGLLPSDPLPANYVQAQSAAVEEGDEDDE